MSIAVLLLSALPMASASNGAGAVIDRIVAFHGVSREPARFVAQGQGFVMDSTHPQHPGDARREDLLVRFEIDASRGDAVLEFTSGGEKPETERRYVRRGRPFQLDEQKAEIDAVALGDIGPATLAALHPSLVARALAARRENLQLVDGGSPTKPAQLLFAWNEKLWRVYADARSGRLERLELRIYNDVHGDGVEGMRYEQYRENLPARIVLTSGSRDQARFDLTSTSATTPPTLPEEKDNWGARVLAPEEIVLRELAPHVFTIDLRALNSRVFVAEFQDHLAVLEGVYNSMNGDLLARTLEKRFGKPIRYFAFSHLHGQYVGGVRSYVHAGATVLVPPTTAPLIEEVVKARHDLRPDALTREPRPLKLQLVKDSLVLEDSTNALRVDNVVSEHTDEYLLFSFPRQKLVMTGDLLFYRGPEQPMRGRSKRLCETVAKLGLPVETMYVSWPLEGYGGVHNTVGFDEFKAACERP